MTLSKRISRPLSVSICRANAANHAAALGVTGSLTKPSFRVSKMFAPTERSSVLLSTSINNRACARSSTGKPVVATSTCLRERNWPV
jgi:hypothetical protein